MQLGRRVAGGTGWRNVLMKIAIPKERRAQERRVAATPDTVKRMVGMGLDVVVEAGAGAGAAGATIAADAAAALAGADIVLKVQRPIVPGDSEADADELAAMKPGTVLIGMLQPLQHPDDVAAYANAGLTA